MSNFYVSSLLAFILSICVPMIYPQDSTKVLKEYHLEYGSLPNIESGARTTVGINSLMFDMINHSLKNSRWNNALTRTFNAGFVQFYLGLFTFAAAPHEFFGHYSRAREFGITPKISLAFPVISGDDVFKVTYHVPVIERQMIVSSGPELTMGVAREELKEIYGGKPAPSYAGNFLLAGKIIDMLMYTQNNVKPFIKDPEKFYMDNASYFRRNPVPNDPLSYVLALTESYGYYDSFVPKNAIWLYRPPNLNVYVNDFFKDQYKRMKRSQILALMDPALLYFFYGNYQYIAHDQATFTPFMFNVSGYRFMPSIRAYLGELGAENYYDLYLVTPSGQQVIVYYRQGGNMFDQIYGGGVEVGKIRIAGNYTLTSQADFWYNERSDKSNFNIMESVDYDITKRWLISISLGYKTKGQIAGKPYFDGLYGYSGFGIRL